MRLYVQQKYKFKQRNELKLEGTEKEVYADWC